MTQAQTRTDALRDALIRISDLAKQEGIPLYVKVRHLDESVTKTVGQLSDKEVEGLTGIEIHADA